MSSLLCTVVSGTGLASISTAPDKTNIALALACENQGFSKEAVTAARTDPAFLWPPNHDRDFKKPGKRRPGRPDDLLKMACFSPGVT